MLTTFILQQYVCYTTILNKFRAARCSSSGGWIVSPQPLVSSASVNSVQYAGVERGDFSTCDGPRPGRHKTVTTPEIIDKIHELILEDRQISAKSIAEQLDISREWVGPIIHGDLDMRKLSVQWVPKCLNADQKRQRCQLSEQNLEFSRRDPNDFLSGAIGDLGRERVTSLWPRDKATISGVSS